MNSKGNRSNRSLFEGSRAGSGSTRYRESHLIGACTAPSRPLCLPCLLHHCHFAIIYLYVCGVSPQLVLVKTEELCVENGSDGRKILVNSKLLTTFNRLSVAIDVLFARPHFQSLFVQFTVWCDAVSRSPSPSSPRIFLLSSSLLQIVP